MARRKKIFGTCHLCGEHKKLSFEHTPPRSAFNNRNQISASIYDIIQNQNGLDDIKGKTVQGGIGGYTLCEKCNNDTGAWYGSAFVEWTYQAMRVLSLSKGEPTLYYLFRIYPLRVIKQIICMLFCINSDQLQTAEGGLVRFVLNRESQFINPNIRVYCFYNPSGRSRWSGGAGLYNIHEGSMQIVNEIIFPPLGYVIAYDGAKPDGRLFDITFFADYRYNDWKEFSLRLPVLPIYTHLPGDYRNRDQVLSDLDKNPSGI